MSDTTHNPASPESKRHDVKETPRAGERTNATERLWKSLEVTYACYSDVQTSLVEAEKQEEDSVKQLNQLRRSIVKRNEERDKYLFELGKVCFKLRNLYSERAKSGDRSDKSSGHGTYIKELEVRGYDRRRAAEWVHDFEAAENGTPATAAKRKASRQQKKQTKAIKKSEPTPSTPAVTVAETPVAGKYNLVTVQVAEDPVDATPAPTSALSLVLEAAEELESACDKFSSMSPNEVVVEAAAADVLGDIIVDLDRAYYRVGKLVAALKEADQVNLERKKAVQSEGEEPEAALAVAS